MADYFSIQGMDMPDNKSEGLLFSAPSPWQYGKQLENQALAKQYYERAIQNQAFDAEKAQYEFNKTKSADARMQALYDDPRYAKAFVNAGVNKLLGESGEAATKYLDSSLGAIDKLIAPQLAAAKTPEEKQRVLLQNAPILSRYGVDIEGLNMNPISVGAINDRYRNDQEFKGKQFLQDDEQDHAWRMLQAELAARLQQARIAASRPTSSSSVGLPKTIDAAYLRTFFDTYKRLPTPEELVKYLRSKPQVDPNVQGGLSESKTTGKNKADLEFIREIINEGLNQPTQPPIPQKPKVIKLDE